MIALLQLVAHTLVNSVAWERTREVAAEGPLKRRVDLWRPAQPVENYLGHFLEKNATNMEKVQTISGKRGARSAPLCC